MDVWVLVSGGMSGGEHWNGLASARAGFGVVKYINAKLLFSGLLVALLSGFAVLVVIQRNRSAAEIATARLHQRIGPLDQR
ncbi:hypothetical protein NS226_24215 [Aureimonas ureilytica]|uniref:Uncharacterized protein n=1 Tax=Aureimonas ureilytica TaxID=401562 RepID=A0A175Q510_9HYPH|nr:hypothetical protein [Aureimonas ureilytica]KTQ63934.1 hypothetical protein NS226_24215 [Aureimonas ureilytica]